MYELPEYQGANLRLCGDSPFTDVEWVVGSLYVPDGHNVYLYNLPCFNGQNANFSASVPDMSIWEAENGPMFDAEFLQLHGIEIMEEEVFLQLHSGVSARYKRSNLRKTDRKSVV